MKKDILRISLGANSWWRSLYWSRNREHKGFKRYRCPFDGRSW